VGDSNYVLSLAITASNSAMGAISNLISGLGPIGGAVAVASAAVIGLGVAATKQAADFQQAMLSNVAHAGLAKSEFQSVSNAILAMAPEVGRSPTQLADAMYPILSAFSGITNQSAKSKLALDTLKLSFEAVAGTTVDGTQVATAAVGTFNALGLATNNAATNSARMSNLMDIMDKTVQDGNMQWGAYQMVISKLATSIQGTSIKFTEASAALAVLTNSGMTARQSQTYLANMFTTMAIKTDAMAKHAKALGISWNAQAYAGMSLAQKIAYINQVTDGNKQKILALLGNNATALRSFNALSTGIKSYGSNLNDLNHAQGALKQSFDTASQGMNFQMQQMKAAGDAFMITIGTQLLPVISDFVKQMIPLVQQFTQWLEKSGALKIAASFLAGALQGLVSTIAWLATTLGGIITFFQQNEWAMDALKAVLIAFAIVVAPMVVAALISMAVAAWAAAVPIIAMALPFIALGLVIAAVIFGIIEAYKHWGAIMDWIHNKTEQTNLKIQISDSQAAVKKDQQQKKSAQDTLKNLDKEKADILKKLKDTKDAATKVELQQQLEMTQRQIDGQNDRIKAADKDAALQKTKQKKLHDDLIESQKDLGTRMDDAVNTWTKTAEDTFDKWLATMAGNINTWTSKAETAFDTFFLKVFGAINTWTSNAETAFDKFFLTLAGKINTGTANAETAFDTFFLTLAGKINTWVAGAVNWGHDLIQNLINGINGMLGSLSGAVGNVASTISSMLHFTRPDKGPLKTVDEWMPHLGDTLILGLNNISPKLQAAAMRAAAAVAGPIKGTTDGSMPSHIFDFIGSNYSGYASGMATTAKREQAADTKAAKQAAALAKQEAGVESHIQKLEQHYNIVVHTHGKGKWTKADATELAKLLAEQTRLQGKSPQTSSGRRN
jgi:TP901 family phage tail tape measure protein